MGKIRNSLAHFKDRLFRLSEDEPLSVLSIVVLILLDIFLLTVLFQGLEAQSRLLTRPDEYVSSDCQEIIIRKEWTPGNRLDKLTEKVVYYHRSTYPSVEKKVNAHPICQRIDGAIQSIKNDNSLIQLFEERDRLKTLRAELGTQFDQSKELFGTTKAQQPLSGDNKLKYQALSIQINTIDRKLNSQPKIIKLWQAVAKGQAQQEAVIKALRSYRFTFPFYETLLQFLFLIPLLVVFYLWYKRSIYRNRLQTVLASHLLAVVSIPIFIKVVQLILDIIPREIIKEFIDLLNSFNLIAIWYYLVKPRSKYNARRSWVNFYHSPRNLGS